MRWTSFLTLAAFGLSAAAEPVPVRGVAWQWCFRNPGLDFCRRTVDTMARLGYNAILPEFGSRLESRHYAARPGAPLGREDFRTFLRQCKERDVAVIPLLNALGHGERSIPWVATLDGTDALTGGQVTVMDLGEEENYSLLFFVLDEYLEDLTACGHAAQYLHLGCDEASGVLAVNAAKYAVSPSELLLRHLLRLHDYCQRKSVRLIVWHDMLMGSQDPRYDGDMQYAHADLTGSWQCRADLPKDIVLMYWNYEPKSSYGVVSGFRDEGFDVWLMPWGLESVRTMAEFASGANLQGVVISTWMDSGGDDPPGDNHFVTQPWMAESIARGADFLVDPGECRKTSTDDPFLRYVGLCFPEESVAFRPLQPSQTYASMTKPEYLVHHAPTAALLGKWPVGNADLAELTEPYAAVWNGTSIAIDACNAVRRTNQLVLYTQEFGASTLCNGYGTEVMVDARGLVLSKTSWGVGDSRIPPGGFVLSGHGTGAASLQMKPGDRVEIRGANGVCLQDGDVTDGDRDLALTLPVGGRAVEEVSFLWGAGNVLPIDGSAFGRVSFTYVDGSVAALDLAFGRDVVCWNLPQFFWGGRPGVRVWPACQESSGSKTGLALTGWSWCNPRPGTSVRECRLELFDRGREMGLLVVAGSVRDASGAVDTLEGETASAGAYALDTTGPCRNVRSFEELNALQKARCRAGETATCERPDGTVVTLVAKSPGEMRVTLPIDSGGIWTFDNPSEGSASFVVRHSVFGALGDGTMDSPAKIVDLDELVETGAGDGYVFTLTGAESLLDLLALPAGLCVERMDGGLWRLVSSADGCLFRWSEMCYSLDSRQSGPDRKVGWGAALPVAYSGDNWSGDAAAVSSVSFVSPSKETNGLVRSGSGALPFAFDEAGTWKVRLDMASGVVLESDVFVKGAFSVLLK